MDIVFSNDIRSQFGCTLNNNFNEIVDISYDVSANLRFPSMEEILDGIDNG